MSKNKVTGKSGLQGTDARKAERHELPVEILPLHGDSAVPIPVRPSNISPHGMFIDTPREFPVGSQLHLRFRLLISGVDLNVWAEVRHSAPGVGIGVEFQDTPPQVLKAIEEEIRLAYQPAVLTLEAAGERRAKNLP